jgi:hypothetical protein
MVVDIINKTLDTTAIVKYRYWHHLQNIYPYFDGHFYEKLGTSIILEKVDQLGTQIFYP